MSNYETNNVSKNVAVYEPKEVSKNVSINVSNDETLLNHTGNVKNVSSHTGNVKMCQVKQAM